MSYKFNPFTANLDFVPETPALDGLSDAYTPAPQHQEFLVYNGGTGLWERATLVGLAASIVFTSPLLGNLDFQYANYSHHIATVL
jgi:hypothetical protein